jgi:hypothetical protein
MVFSLTFGTVLIARFIPHFGHFPAWLDTTSECIGQKLRTLVYEPKSTGNYEVIWDGKDDEEKEVASGIYFYQLKAGDNTETKKMLLLR